jgi:hypothetical protein
MADSRVEDKGKKMTGLYDVLENITIYGREANAAAIRSYNREHGTAIAIRQVKYLHKVVEIVFTRLTKTHMLTAGMRRHYIADFDLSIGHDDTIDQQLDQLALLRERGTV